MIKKYSKKPVVIEAIQYVEDYKYRKSNIEQIIDFVGKENIHIDPYEPYHINTVFHIPYINTLEGKMKITDGCYIIKGIHGEFYPCQKEIFEQSYEEVTE